MKASRENAINTARLRLAERLVFLDTETTGIGNQAEIIDMAIVDYYGNVLLNSLVKPINSIPTDATKIHGITNEMVVDAPTWEKIWPEVRKVLSNQIVGIYNEEFDIRMMKQSCQFHSISWAPPFRKSFCIMELYAKYYGAWNEYYHNFTWQSLEKAGSQCGIDLPNSHRALADTFLSRAVLFHMAGEDWKEFKEKEASAQQPQQCKPKIIGEEEIGKPRFSPGKMISFISPRRDTGKSTILANVASQLSVMGYRVGIADLNFEYPHLHHFFGVYDEDIHFSLKDFLQAGCSIKDVAFHVGRNLSGPRGRESSKAKVLWLFPSITYFGSDRKFRSENYDPHLLNQGLQTIIRDMDLDFLFLDTHGGMNDETAFLLTFTDMMISVFRPETQDLQGAIHSLDIARMLDVPNLFLAVNKVLSKYEFSQVKAEIESAFDCSVAGLLPFNEDIVEMGSSDLLVLRKPDHPWSIAVLDIVKSIMNAI